MTDGEKRHRPARDARPWFGPKRIGWGLRPQTWQGWLVIALIAVAAVIVTILRHAH